MIQRVLIKENFTILNAEIEFSKGLMVFSGSSGAGKSVLMRSILSVFGLEEANAQTIEATVENFQIPEDFDADDETIIKQIKKDKIRYFLNGQTIKKSQLKELGVGYLFHLNHKDSSEFEQKNLISLLDSAVESKEKEYKKNIEDFKEIFHTHAKKTKQLAVLVEQKRKSQELKEFAKYEISKIESINPKNGEYEELMSLKKLLSKKDKIEAALSRAEEIFGFENAVNELFELLGEDAGFFSDAMNEVRGIMENAKDSTEELEGVDIEALLERIEKVSDLIKKYGSIEDAILYKNKKIKELESYEDIDANKDKLEAEIKELKSLMDKKAEEFSNARKKHIKILEDSMNEYLEMLYMSKASLALNEKEIDESGIDKLDIKINKNSVENLSSGEFNRTRLALLAAKVRFNTKSNTQVLFLDEIDANLSGEESASVANVLKFLSSRFQIFAISHQAQLTSKADKHFLVKKENEITQIKELSKDERIAEIARIVSKEEITKEALLYAKKLFE